MNWLRDKYIEIRLFFSSNGRSGNGTSGCGPCDCGEGTGLAPRNLAGSGLSPREADGERGQAHPDASESQYGSYFGTGGDLQKGSVAPGQG